MDRFRVYRVPRNVYFEQVAIGVHKICVFLASGQRGPRKYVCFEFVGGYICLVARMALRYSLEAHFELFLVLVARMALK